MLLMDPLFTTPFQIFDAFRGKLKTLIASEIQLLAIVVGTPSVFHCCNRSTIISLVHLLMAAIAQPSVLARISSKIVVSSAWWASKYALTSALPNSWRT